MKENRPAKEPAACLPTCRRQSTEFYKDVTRVSMFDVPAAMQHSYFFQSRLGVSPMAIQLKNIEKPVQKYYVRKIKNIQQSPNFKGDNSTPSRGSCEDANERDRLAGCTLALDNSTDTIGLLILRSS